MFRGRTFVLRSARAMRRGKKQSILDSALLRRNSQASLREATMEMAVRPLSVCALEAMNVGRVGLCTLDLAAMEDDDDDGR